MGIPFLPTESPQPASHRPEAAGHERHTTALERAGCCSMSDKAGAPGKGAPKWLQEGKGTSQPLPPARCKTLMQCVGNTWNSLDIKSNNKTGISPLPRTPQMKLLTVFLPLTFLIKVIPAKQSLTACLSHSPLPFSWTKMAPRGAVRPQRP